MSPGHFPLCSIGHYIISRNLAVFFILCFLMSCKHVDFPLCSRTLTGYIRSCLGEFVIDDSKLIVSTWLWRPLPHSRAALEQQALRYSMFASHSLGSHTKRITVYFCSIVTEPNLSLLSTISLLKRRHQRRHLQQRYQTSKLTSWCSPHWSYRFETRNKQRHE